MKLTQEYIERKKQEFESKGLDKYIAEALINDLIIKFENEKIKEELGVDNPDVYHEKSK